MLYFLISEYLIKKKSGGEKMKRLIKKAASGDVTQGLTCVDCGKAKKIHIPSDEWSKYMQERNSGKTKEEAANEALQSLSEGDINWIVHSTCESCSY
jgi:hypothetical protein